MYSSGFADREDHAEQLNAGPVIDRYEISEARTLTLADGVVLLSYKAEFSRLRDGLAQEPESMYVSSVWKSLDGVWRNVFSQDTACDQRYE